MFQHLPQPERIAAIIPCYGASGDTTEIITIDGRRNIADIGIKTVIRRLAISRAADLSIIKKHASGVTQSAILQPLPLTPGLVLCPVKVRTPRASGDTCTGYINYYAVKSVDNNAAKPYKAAVLLTGGIKVPVLWTAATVNKRLQQARLAMTYTLYPAAGTIKESISVYAPEIVPIIQKFIEIIFDILAAKQR